MDEPRTLVRRRRTTNEMPIGFEISRARRFFFSIPDGIPYDDEDADRIKDEIMGMHQPPDELQGPVASGLGDLVSDAFSATFWDDTREDYEIMLDIEEAVRRGLKCRAWNILTSEVDPQHLAAR